MNFANPAVQTHFAPPARIPSTRRQLHHNPTLLARTGSTRLSAQEFVSYRPSLQPLPTQYSPPPSLQFFQDTDSSQSQSRQYPSYSPNQPKISLQRKATNNSVNFMNHHVNPGSLVITGHRRQTSTSTSNSSISRIPSGHMQYPSSTIPTIHGRSSSMSAGDTYVARLRRAKATVWSAQGQRESLDPSNSKDDKYNKKYVKRGTSGKVLTVSFRPKTNL